MAYAGYAPGHRVVERTPLERALRAIARPETLDLLERLSKNVARAPSEAKYRKLKRANATIGREIFDDEHAMRAMMTMGWIAETIEGSECLTLPRGTTTTMREVRAMDEARTALRRRLEEEMRAKIRARAMANDPRRAALREAVEADRAERAVREPVTTGSARRGARDGDDGDGEGGRRVGKLGVLRIMRYYATARCERTRRGRTRSLARSRARSSRNSRTAARVPRVRLERSRAISRGIRSHRRRAKTMASTMTTTTQSSRLARSS